MVATADMVDMADTEVMEEGVMEAMVDTVDTADMGATADMAAAGVVSFFVNPTHTGRERRVTKMCSVLI